jgi:hypothetical protein
MTTRLVEVRQNVLKQNDLVARDLRQRFQDSGVFVVSMVSSPGSGKTAFLEKRSLCCEKTAASRGEFSVPGLLRSGRGCQTGAPFCYRRRR